jgi:hypothetical protein
VSRSRLALAGAFAAILVLAVALRRWGWENWSLWLDECLQVFVARQPSRQIIERLAYERTHPPLDYFLTHFALKISASALFLRWIPTLLSAATAVLVFVRAGASRRPYAALGAMFCFAVLPFAVHQGQELRPYALALFWIAAADVCRSWHADGGRRLALVAFGASSLCAVYTLLFAFFPLAAFWTLDLLDARGPGEAPRRARTRLAVLPAAVLAFLPWVVAVRAHLTRPNEMPAPALTLSLVARQVVGFLGDRQPGTERAGAAVFVLALAGLGTASAAGRERRALAVEAAFTVGGAAAFLLATNHWFEPRYFWFFLWPLSRACGEGLGAVSRLARGRGPAFAAALAVFLALEWPALAENAATGRPDWRRPVGYAAFRRVAPAFVPLDWWSFMLLDYQMLARDAPFRMDREPCLTSAALDATLQRLGEGWVFRAEWGGSESGERLKSSGLRPWATFPEADGVAVYRFEKGRIVP